VVVHAEKTIDVSDEWKQRAHITREQYEAMYQQSIDEPEMFWAEQAKAFTWHTPWEQVKDTSFNAPVSVNWFKGATLNITENCLDRHLTDHAEQTAIIWEGDEPEDVRRITYRDLHAQVCRFANVLKKQDVKKGDRVTIYMPLIPEAAMAMLACARIGAVHSVVFGGFSAEALRGRIESFGSDIVITADEGLRGGKHVPLKANTDQAVAGLDHVRHVITVKHSGGQVPFQSGRDVWYHEACEGVSDECPAEIMRAEDPLFILFTSGSTGKPKGLQHNCGGYMVWTGLTHKLTFDCYDGDIFWCTADVGWITGHSYTVYGALLNRTTTVMYEGVPQYPDWSRMWEMVDRHQVNTFYTAPTAIRAMMREGDDYVRGTSRTSLRLLGTVGEPINPEAWRWYYKVVGDSRCPIMDTWWQTETGGHMITPLPGATPLKPGSATWPFFGVKPVLMDTEGQVVEGAGKGVLCFADSWPGQAVSIYGDHDRFEQTYFSQYAGLYCSDDMAELDADGYWWISGRADDVLNVSGHRIGTADIESALVGHSRVTEAAVVGYPHEIKGQGMYCFVTLQAGAAASEAVENELKQWVRKEIGPFATPDHIHFTPALPKTRSGKIMRRILRKIAAGDSDDFGDTSTLLNPEIVEQLIEEKQAS
jgi:acetyl-CoA synthetase